MEGGAGYRRLMVWLVIALGDHRAAVDSRGSQRAPVHSHSASLYMTNRRRPASYANAGSPRCASSAKHDDPIARGVVTEMGSAARRLVTEPREACASRLS